MAYYTSHFKSRIHNILSPDFVGSEFPGGDVFSDLERCEHLFWNLTGESVISFRRIIHDVEPVMSMYTRRRQPYQTEPQQHFSRGHCRYHNFSTQIIMDSRGNIVYIQLGFLGHNNDSAQLQMMPSSMLTSV